MLETSEIMTYRHRCYFPVLELFRYLKEFRICPLKNEKMAESSKYPTSWKIILERVTSNDVISEAVFRMYVVINKAEKRMPYGGISWYHRMFDVISEVSHKTGFL